jgi:hypothetical protein
MKMSKSERVGMKLVVVALTVVMTVFAESGDLTTGVDLGEISDTTKVRNLQDEVGGPRLLEQPKSILAKNLGVKKSVRFPLPGEGSDQTLPVAEVEEGPASEADYSPEQIKAIVEEGQQKSFEVAEEKDQSLSTVDLIETELSRNKKAQDEVTEELTDEATIPKRRQQLTELLSRLKEEEQKLVDENREVPREIKKPLLTKVVLQERMNTINTMVEELKILLNGPIIDKSAVDSQISNIKTIIGRLHEKFEKYIEPSLSRVPLSVKSVMDDAQESYEQLIIVADKAATIIDNLDEIFKSIGSRNENSFSFTPEEQTFVKTLIKKTETFADLRAQATQAINQSNVVRMQELQDEMRDFYEDLLRSGWKNKDEELNTLDGNFISNVRASINDLLQQFKDKASSFEGALKNKKGFIAKAKYQFKRLFARAKRFPELKYRSEAAENRERFGLDLVDFQKAARDGYVGTVKSTIKSFTDALKDVKNLSAQGDQEVSLAQFEALKTTRDNVQPVMREVSALQGVAFLKGTVSFESVQKYLNIFDVPSTPASFFTHLEKEAGTARYKEVALGLLKKVNSEEATQAIKNIEEKKFLTPSQERLLADRYGKWFKEIDDHTGIHRASVSLENLTALRLLATFNGAPAEYVNLFSTPSTGQYVIDAYKARKNVKVSSNQAQAMVDKLSDFVAQFKEAELLLAKKTVAKGDPIRSGV